MNVREQRAAHLALRTIAPFALLLPALALLVVWIVGRAVRPVRRFADVLRDRERDALDPLDGDGLPDEIRPVATALNDLLARLKESVERERSFIADAAHELRTPLTALDLQVQSLRAEAAGGGHDDAIARLEAGVARAARLVEQLLALAREERDSTRVREPVALADAARDAIGEMLSLADKHRIDLGMGRSDAVQVAGDREALRVLIRNLPTMPLPLFRRPAAVDVSVERHDDEPIRRAGSSPMAAQESRQNANGCSTALSSGARHGRPGSGIGPGAGALDRGHTTAPTVDTPRRRPLRARGFARTGRFSPPSIDLKFALSFAGHAPLPMLRGRRGFHAPCTGRHPRRLPRPDSSSAARSHPRRSGRCAARRRALPLRFRPRRRSCFDARRRGQRARTQCDSGRHRPA
ncbi:MAG: HAMP domain-containing protein [Proteobacteria bacterium]|nr:HAMP domain-containing protein [Pseudomonadota bacterium]